MTTAYRLPDQFSPGALDATAATPTCCCCCCCCLASTLTTPIVLHGALSKELRDSEPPTPAHPGRRRLAPTLSALVWIALLIALVSLISSGALTEDTWMLTLGGTVAVAIVVAWAIAKWAASRQPVMAGARVLLGTIAFAAEFVVGGFLLLFYGSYVIIGPVVTAMGIGRAIKTYER